MASPKSSKSRSKSAKSKSSKSRAKSARPKSSKSKKRRFANVPPVIGFLVAATTAAWKPYTDAFELRLATYGWVKDTDYTVDYEPPGGAAGDLQAMKNWAKQFVTNGVDIIVTAGTEAAQACQAATATIPIVFASLGDPVGSLLVKSIATPGGNLTGCSNMQTDPNVLTQQINVMLTKHKPKVVGVIGNPNVEPAAAAMTQALQILQAIHVTAYRGDIPDNASIQTVIDDLYTTHKVDTLFICSDPLLSAYADNIDDATSKSAKGVARGQKIKAMYEFREYVDRHPNATQCYGPNFASLFSQSAWYVYEILNNHVNPADLAVYLPSAPYDQVPP